VDHKANDITEENKFMGLSQKLIQDQSNWFLDMDPIKQIVIPSMIEKSASIAQARSQEMIQKARARAKGILGREITRLNELKKINPNISNEEIQLARARMVSLLDCLSSARPRMDALRLIRVQ
jgi:ATP-dependent helicase HepA